MELGLKDKVILVTGGASGIGQEIVKKLQALAAIHDNISLSPCRA